MDNDPLKTVRCASARLHDLADRFPDFRYVKLSGPAVRDERLAYAALLCFTGSADCEYQHDADRGVARCVYGEELDEALASLRSVADAVWLAVRHVMRHFRAADCFPSVREAGTPFMLLDAMITMAVGLPRALSEEFAELGVTFHCAPGGAEVHEGPVTVHEGCLVFPDRVYVPPKTAAGGDGGAAFRELMAAATRGELSAVHSLSPAFELLSAFVDSCLTMDQLGRDIEEAHERTASKADQNPRELNLIPPSEQAEMLGWAEPTSVPTLKQVGALRRAVQARGIKLDEQKIPGRGNKTFVPRDQWASIVSLVELVARGSPNPSKAIAALAAGTRLTNSTGRTMSYWCHACSHMTRTAAEEPVCDKCWRHMPLQPMGRK